MRLLFKSQLLPLLNQPCHLSWARWHFFRNPNTKLELEHPTNMTELRFSLGPCNVFCLFVLDFVHVATPTNKELSKSQMQMQTSDWLTNVELTMLQTLNAKSVEPPAQSRSRSKGSYTGTPMQARSKLYLYIWESKLKEITDKSGIGLFSLNSAEGANNTSHHKFLAVKWKLLLLGFPKRASSLPFAPIVTY